MVLSHLWFPVSRYLDIYKNRIMLLMMSACPQRILEYKNLRHRSSNQILVDRKFLKYATRPNKIKLTVRVKRNKIVLVLNEPRILV